MKSLCESLDLSTVFSGILGNTAGRELYTIHISATGLAVMRGFVVFGCSIKYLPDTPDLQDMAPGDRDRLVSSRSSQQRVRV